MPPLPPGYEWNQDPSKYGGVNGFKQPSREELDVEKEQGQVEEQLFSEWDWQGDLGPQGEAMPELAIGWQPNGNADFGPGIGGWWKKAVSNVRQSWQTGYQEGLKISGVEKLAVKAEAKGTGQDADKILEGMEAERKPKDQNSAYMVASTEATKEIFEQLLWGALEGLGASAMKVEQGIGAAGNTLGRVLGGEEVSVETIKDDFNASRLAYSAIFDQAIFAEMNRRIDAGVRPDLAQQEIMIEKPWTLWPELIGQGVFDPLNALTLVGKAGQQIKFVKNAKKGFQEVANPNIAKILDESVDAIKNMDEGAAYQKIDDLVRSQQDLVTAHAGEVAGAEGKLYLLSNDYKISSLTSSGKIAHLANETSEIGMHIVNTVGGDEALEVMRGIVKSVDPDPEIAAEGIAAMLHFPNPAALFSEAGNNFTVLLSKMTTKHGDTWLKNIEDLRHDPAALTKDLLTKLDEVGEEMFPSVSSMLKAEDEIKMGKVLADGKAVEKRAALAKRAAELPPSVRAATRFHDNAQKVIGPVNKVFVGAYMGWSPGYAFRNLSNNSLQLLVDYGPGILLGDANKMFAKTEKFHGGKIMGAASEGSQAASLFQVDKITGEALALDTSIKGAIKAGLSTPKTPFLAVSQVAESNGAKRILAKTYMKTFEQGTRAMVKALAPDLRAAGFSEDIIKKLPTYIMQNDGDAAKVIDALRNDTASGVIDLFNDIDRIDPKYKSFLSDVGKWDDYAEQVLRAPTREAAQEAATKIFDDIAQAGDYVYREGKPVVDRFDQFAKMAEKGGLTETRGYLISLRKTESRKAIQAAEAILAEADDLGAKLGLQVGSMKTGRGITGLNTWGNDAAKEADRINDIAWKLTEAARKGGADLKTMWMGYPELFPGTPPAVLDAKTFKDALWAQYDTVTSQTWAGARDTAIGNVTGYLDDLKAAGVPISDDWYESIKVAQEGAQQYDNAMVGRFGELIEETPLAYGSRTTQISAIAAKNGIPTASAAGAPTDKKTLAIINKYADVNYKSLEDVPISVAEEAFAKKAGKAPSGSDTAGKVRDPDLAYMDDAGKIVEPRKRILPPPSEADAPPISRAIHEQMDKVKEMRAWMMDDITKSFGKKQVVDKVAESALQKAQKELTQKLAENKLISSRVAQANRDFTLLNYGDKSYWDTALAYLYPFHFWYKGTYTNWMKRIAQNPAVLGNYARYKEHLGTVHAGMPEWWKYNINTNDLPGVDVENPLYFNLEQTLWPLNGITGMDFNDPAKRVNWWTYSLDFANKFGPSTWTPLSMMTGMALHAQGEKEAGESWLGRLIPQTASIKAGASLLGMANLELDPLVNIYSGGLDKYERRRAQRALSNMMQEAQAGNSQYSPEQIQDAAYSQEGEIWEQAVKNSTRARAPSQLSSFLFGVGFKGRTEQDMEIDKFYEDYGKLWTMRPNLSPQEFSEGMEALKGKYSFMDTVLLSKGDGVERDAGLAYNVLTRIPPGKTSDIAKAVGIDADMLSKFFDDKGQIDKWPPADYKRFMAGVLDISAILEIPPDMTRQEWLKAKNTYKTVMNDAKAQFGDEIWDMVDGYYAAKTKSYEQADAYLEQHPEVQEALDWKAQRIMNSPLLSSYYGGAQVIEGYYRSQMYKDIETKLGAEIFDVMDEYNDIKTYGESAEAKTFYNQHKSQIKEYYKIKDEWGIITNQSVAQLSAHIPEGQGAGIREDADLSSQGAQDLAGAIQPQQQMSYQDFSAALPSHTMNVVQDYFNNSEPLPESARKQLERLANEMGYYSADDLLQAIGTSMYEGQP